jgi:trans-aconitate 2-methyltransferase
VTNATSTWNPEQYARFREERSKPFYDLAAMVQKHRGMRVLDLGCGDGSLTSWLHDHLEAVETLGVDNSDTMLAAAEQHARPGLRFERADITTFEAPAQFDLVFANASLQWVPDHEALIPRLCGLLAPGGQIAVQVPANDDHVSHTTAHEVAATEPFVSALGTYLRGFDRVLRPARYAELLWEQGCEEQQVRLNVYPHLMPGYEAVVEWVRGTYLTAYEARLGAELFAQFLAEYERRLAAALPQRPYLYTYPRVLMWGRLAG